MHEVSRNEVMKLIQLSKVAYERVARTQKQSKIFGRGKRYLLEAYKQTLLDFFTDPKKTLGAEPNRVGLKGRRMDLIQSCMELQSTKDTKYIKLEA